MKRLIGVIVTNSRISMVFDGKPQAISSDHPNFEALKTKLLTKSYTDEEVEALIRPSASVEREAKASGGKLSKHLRIEKDDIITYKGNPLPVVLQKKLLEQIAQNAGVKGFCQFVENLMMNPHKSAIEEFYLFLKSGNLPITEDGHFLAYKRVRNDYRDVHSGTMDNSVGKVVKMKREEVDTNRNNTCSRGLHFCSYSYLSHFGGDRVVVLKINPADVVSIPTDYNFTKGRTWKYEVVADVTDEGDVLSDLKAEKIAAMCLKD